MACSPSIPRPSIPRPAPGRLTALTDHPFAHRGLHGADRTENGRPAFEAAIAAGHGIECDVRAGRGGEAIVFHDADLLRVTGSSLAVATLSGADLPDHPLPDGSAPMTLIQLVALIAGRTPVLVEVKMPGVFDPALCRSVAAALSDAGPSAAVMGFDPRVARWFRAHAPAVRRGLVASNEGRPGLRTTARHLAALRLARPDFVAWDIRDLPDPVPTAARARGLAVFTWTVRSADERARARACADQPIFEG